MGHALAPPVEGVSATQVRAMPFWLLPLLVCLLFLSGISALVCQVLWLRLLSLTFGVTTHAASTVLASFMGGLALGSFVAGRIADRSTRPLRLFGVVELMIGVCALATPTVLAAVHTAYIALFSHMPDSLALVTLASLALEVIWFRVLGILLGPTSYAFTLMLAAVLAGIALGSALITPLVRWRGDWLQGLALQQIGAGLVAVNSCGARSSRWWPYSRRSRSCRRPAPCRIRTRSRGGADSWSARCSGRKRACRRPWSCPAHRTPTAARCI
jgi:MFS family permease